MLRLIQPTEGLKSIITRPRFEPTDDRKYSRLWLRRWQFVVWSWGCLPISLLSKISSL